MLKENVVRKKANTNNDWVVVTKEEIKTDWGLPLNWELLLKHKEIVCSDDYVYKLEKTEYVEYPEIEKIIGKIIFKNNENGKEIEWDLETAEKITMGYGHNLRGRLVAGEIISTPLGTIRLIN